MDTQTSQTTSPLGPGYMSAKNTVEKIKVQTEKKPESTVEKQKSDEKIETEGKLFQDSEGIPDLEKKELVEKINEKSPALVAKDLEIAIDQFLLGVKNSEKLDAVQKKLFKHTALIWGLNPLKREIHCVPREVREWRNGQSFGTGKFEATIVIGYEVYIKRAEKTGNLDGWGIKFEEVKTSTGSDMKCILTIHKKTWSEPFIYEAYLSENKQDNMIWKKMPKFMLRKTTISQGFRLAFPEDLGGLPYIPEEIGLGVIQDGQVVEDTPETAIRSKTASQSQMAVIRQLLPKKGQKEAKILSFFKIKALSQLSETDALRVIKKLRSIPDYAEAFDDSMDETITEEDLEGMEEQSV